MTPVTPVCMWAAALGLSSVGCDEEEGVFLFYGKRKEGGGLQFHSALMVVREHLCWCVQGVTH